MKYERHDYLIVELDSKKYLAQVLNLKADKRPAQIILEKDVLQDSPEKINLRQEMIVANLGKKPRTGSKVYGVDIQIFFDDIEFKGWPYPMRMYREIDEDETQLLRNVMARVRKVLVKHRAFDWTQTCFSMILKPNSGKMAGYYKYRQRKTDADDELCLSPKELTHKQELAFVVFHECAHGIWHRQVPADIQARWANLFKKRAVLNRTGTQEFLDLFGLIASLHKEGMDFAEIKKNLRQEYEEEYRIFSEVLKHIKKVWHMDDHDQENVFKRDQKAYMSMWPITNDHTNWKPDVSEYATTNVREFFAESMAYYFCGIDLPADVKKYCENSLKRLIKTYS